MPDKLEEIKLNPESGALALYFSAALAASVISFFLVFTFTKKVYNEAGELYGRHYELLSTAAREHKLIINSDTEHNIFMLPWRRAALKRGFRSSVTFPVAGVGIVTFYAEQANFFTKDEERLLASLAENVTYAVNSLKDGCPGEKA